VIEEAEKWNESAPTLKEIMDNLPDEKLRVKIAGMRGGKVFNSAKEEEKDTKEIEKKPLRPKYPIITKRSSSATSFGVQEKEVK